MNDLTQTSHRQKDLCWTSVTLWRALGNTVLFAITVCGNLRIIKLVCCLHPILPGNCFWHSSAYKNFQRVCQEGDENVIILLIRTTGLKKWHGKFKNMIKMYLLSTLWSLMLCVKEKTVSKWFSFISCNSTIIRMNGCSLCPLWLQRCLSYWLTGAATGFE